MLIELGGGVFPGYIARERAVEAPVSGIVVSVSSQQGQAAQIDQTILSICPEDGMELSVLIGETDLETIHAGTQVLAKLDAWPDDWFTGTVKSVSAVGTRASDGAKFEVRVLLDADARLRLGLSATAYFMGK